MHSSKLDSLSYLQILFELFGPHLPSSLVRKAFQKHQQMNKEQQRTYSPDEGRVRVGHRRRLWGEVRVRVHNNGDGSNIPQYPEESFLKILKLVQKQRQWP